ncbi:nephrocystin-3-like isoform X2 [Haliotis rufescens]|uniref:nephrocystin-3-like isoform X1 n=1 Tax=Haliotis rufescens TaxID=6454 RepID=UPI00201E9CBD|nr:nephrocystin-3-like isoform X1 [Haliotis rufescens]XP_048254266.1 nephrocystin-3-like isoform X2 [Haliotis rufescens]
MSKCVKGKLKDPRTCRIFFSSPFGGMEEERDELTRKYFPQLQHLCSSRGVQFVPVDMRWGITSEAADKAQTVNICLKEVDRCDIFVGFYGQRYGWHGLQDKALQQNIDNALSRFPWLKDKRNCSVTELEFLHGHLNKPGATPACFCFRDKGYDDGKASSLEKAGDKKGAAKFQCESADARKRLDSLRHKVEATKNKTISVHMDYFSPEEGANHMFNAIWEYLTKVLLTEEDEEMSRVTERQAEQADHDKFQAARQSLYVGGDKYFKQLDKALLSGAAERVLVTGEAGQGKSALLANWVGHVKKTQPRTIVISHYIGCSQFSDKAVNILRRLVVAITQHLDVKDKGHAVTRYSKLDIQEMMADLQTCLQRAEKAKLIVVMVIDGLNKMETPGKTTKALFWWPDALPKTVKVVLSTIDTDTAALEELVTRRQYRRLTVGDLEVTQRKQICEKALGGYGKALSKQQLQRVVDSRHTSSPLYLNILVAELEKFGSFRQLDDKLNSLLKSDSIEELCALLLERLESDYNTTEYPRVVQMVFQLLQVAHEGLSESEITEILDIPITIWLPLYCALEQFIVLRSGLLRFSFPQLGHAVEQRYLTSTQDRSSAIKILIKFFGDKRKSHPVWPQVPYSIRKRPAFELPWLQEELGDKAELSTTLTDLNVLHTLVKVDEYSLLELWKATGHSLTDVTTWYLKAYDEAVKELSMTLQNTGVKPAGRTAPPAQNKGVKPAGGTAPPAQKLLFHLENVRYFMDLAGCKEGVARAGHKIIQTLEKLQGQCEENVRQDLLSEHRYYLACCLCDRGEYREAETLHTQVIQYWRGTITSGVVDIKQAETKLAWALNGQGLVYFQQQQYTEAEPLLRESECYHKKHGNKRNEADCLVNLGLVQLKTDNPQKAADKFLAALKLYEAVHYDSVPHTIGNLYTNLGLAYKHMNKLDLAEKYYFKSVEVKAKSVGEEHPALAAAYLNLGTLEGARKHWARVEEYTLKAHVIYKVNDYGASSKEFRNCLENLVNCYLHQGKYEVATPFYWTVFNALTSQGRMCECLAWVHNSMAKHYLDIKQYDQADRILKALVHSPKKTAATFVYIDQLDQARPANTRPKRLKEETLDHGLTVYPNNLHLLKQKATTVFISSGDVDGAMKYWSSVGARAEHYASLVEWCQEAGQSHMAADILQQALQLFPDLG